MFFGLFAAIYERKCQECGYTWQVPRSIARHRMRGIPAMTVIGASKEGGFGQPGGPGLSNLHSGIAARAEAMEGYRICSKCGVDSFTQRPVRRAS
jgi:predicted nucleic-acid-binding Zn-ribbon protein